MQNSAIVALCLLLLSCTGPRAGALSPIDAFVTRLDDNRAVWLNGGSPTIDLPTNAWGR